ncbi:hypothetical protein HBI72_030650 [Parastagonospora nodorum]|nr:hypothetical protein HBI72_030650 [Parastagonospora nodorum]
MDLNFVPSVAFIPDVYIADSLRARTPINLSAVLYEQAAAQTSLPAKISNIDLDFVLSVAFISDVHMANSLRARTPINLSAVLYEQAAAQTSLPAKVSNISLRIRTLINLSTVLYEQADAQSSLPAKVSIIDLNFVPSVAFDAIGNVELTGNFPTALLNPRSLALKRPASFGSDLNCGRTNPTIATLPAKRIKTDEDCKKSTHRQGFNGGSSLKLQKTIRDNIEELICVSKVKHTYVQAHTVPYSDSKKYLGNSKNLAYNISKFYKSKNIQLLRPVFKLQRYDYYNLQDRPTPEELGSIYVLQSVDEIRADVADVFDTVVSKLDEVPTRELSSYIKTELLRDNSCKFYRLVITSEDTHCKQTIKKAYIMSLERASLILFMT